MGMSSDAERALQFARSAPGIITALVGMGRPGHVLENIKAAQIAPLTAEVFAELFARE
jgi:aryl-alcohol dehydrogenase-like predicted oxidoreductase